MQIAHKRFGRNWYESIIEPPICPATRNVGPARHVQPKARLVVQLVLYFNVKLNLQIDLKNSCLARIILLKRRYSMISHFSSCNLLKTALPWAPMKRG